MVTKLILGISGSPRKQATEYVLTEALGMMEENGIRIAKVAELPALAEQVRLELRA